MLVNPQYFNYKLIIGSLLVVLVTVVTLSFFSVYSLKNSHEYLAQEKKLVEIELSEALLSLNKMKKDTNHMSEQLDMVQFRLDSIAAMNNVKTYKTVYRSN